MASSATVWGLLQAQNMLLKVFWRITSCYVLLIELSLFEQLWKDYQWIERVRATWPYILFGGS
jgi:hypothetical protein